MKTCFPKIFSQYFITMSSLYFVLCNGIISDGSRDYVGAFVSFNYTSDGSFFVVGSNKFEEGSYGTHSPKTNVSGVIHLPYYKAYDGGNKFGCSHTYSFVDPSQPWIALVARGICKFSEKILSAESRNASGILIYDFEGQSSKIVMSHKEAQGIVAVTIDNTLGRQIAQLVESGHDVYGTISKGKLHVNSGSTHLRKTSIIFVSISFMIIMAVSLAWLVFYYFQRFRLIRNHNRGQQRRRDATKNILTKLSSRSLKQTDSLVEDGVCAVCLEVYKSGDNIRDLPCNHIFHKKCIDPWLQYKQTCPMCKVNIIKTFDKGTQSNPAFVMDEIRVNASILPEATQPALPPTVDDTQEEESTPPATTRPSRPVEIKV